MKKFFRKVHIWLSIPVGIFISIICLTGAILVFETEITESANRERYFVEETDGRERLPISVIVDRVTGFLSDSISISSVQIPFERDRTYRLGVAGQNRTTVYVDPYTGKVVDTHTYDPRGFFGQVRQLHRWLMFSGENRVVGKRIVGISTMTMIVIIVTGMAVWLPRNKKVLKNRLKIRVRSGWRLFWYDLHVDGGFYITMLLLVMALTGLTWSFEWYRNGFYGAFGVEMRQSGGSGGKQQQKGGREQKREKSSIDYTLWDRAIDEIQKEVESYRTITVTGDAVSVSFRSVFGNGRASDRYAFDSESGAITTVTPYAEQPKQSKLRGWVYAIHTGSWGGVVVKIIYFLAALVGGVLPLTGYFLYLKKRCKRKIH